MPVRLASYAVMAYTFAIWMIRALEVMFFTGLFGCALAVVFSWISIFGVVFKRGE
ncbi:MAG: hypothetical protein P4K83_01400 [Terracidiphilus sp.]|nr:hypothetical protein [Terracidiphilus sp.]